VPSEIPKHALPGGMQPDRRGWLWRQGRLYLPGRQRMRSGKRRVLSARSAMRWQECLLPARRGLRPRRRVLPERAGLLPKWRLLPRRYGMYPRRRHLLPHRAHLPNWRSACVLLSFWPMRERRLPITLSHVVIASTRSTPWRGRARRVAVTRLPRGHSGSGLIPSHCW
jgi:hypothetical protein